MNSKVTSASIYLDNFSSLVKTKVGCMRSILIVASVFPPDAVTSSYLNFDLADVLSKTDKVTVIRPYPSRPKGVTYTGKDIPQYNNFDTVMVNSYRCPSSNIIGRFRESISFGHACRKFIKEHHNEIDFIYNHSWHLFGYYIVAKTAVKYGIPYMAVVQDIYPESLFTGRHFPSFIKEMIKSTLGKFDKYTLRHASRVRTISEEMRSYLINTRDLDENKVYAVDNWQDDTNHFFKPKQKSNLFVFTYLGSINSHSNVDLIIRSFVLANLPNALLKIFGGGNKKGECVELAKSLGAKNIEFHYVERTKVPNVQAEADVLLFALSKGNGAFSLPSKVTSYMLSGRPILASIDQESATTRYINNAQCGFTVAPDNEDYLAEGFKTMYYMSYKELATMGQNAREFAEKHLTREVNLSIVINKIKEVLN